MQLESVSRHYYPSIFIEERPLIDVRSPIEFKRGCFPQSVNHFLMQDSEREQIGTCFKQYGQAAAINLGHSLIKGEIKQKRIKTWVQHLEQYPNAYLYCFRGGLRSQICHQWLKEAGLHVPYIDGGYKAMRQFLIQTIHEIPQHQKLLLLSGCTGSGKTALLNKHKRSIDLEAIAKHRGSSFGQCFEAQPSQIDFENTLAVALLKQNQMKPPYILLEDESHLIGRTAIPQPFYLSMQQASILVLNESLENRVTRIINEYITGMRSGFIQNLGTEEGVIQFQQYLKQGIRQIKKRLGGKLHDRLQLNLSYACNQHECYQMPDVHRIWIAPLLCEYYDPMYQYQLDKKKHNIIFQGSYDEIVQWLDENNA